MSEVPLKASPEREVPRLSDSGPSTFHHFKVLGSGVLEGLGGGGLSLSRGSRVRGECERGMCAM